jgi:hypothetical protein
VARSQKGIALVVLVGIAAFALSRGARAATAPPDVAPTPRPSPKPTPRPAPKPGNVKPAPKGTPRAGTVSLSQGQKVVLSFTLEPGTDDLTESALHAEVMQALDDLDLAHTMGPTPSQGIGWVVQATAKTGGTIPIPSHFTGLHVYVSNALALGATIHE